MPLEMPEFLSLIIVAPTTDAYRLKRELMSSSEIRRPRPLTAKYLVGLSVAVTAIIYNLKLKGNSSRYIKVYISKYVSKY